MNEELIEALENRLEHGEDKESLREEVLAAGHTDEDFEEAFLEAVRRYHLSGAGEDSEVSLADSASDNSLAIPNSRARGDLHTLKIDRAHKRSELIGYSDLLRVGWQIGNQGLRILGGFVFSLLLLSLGIIIVVLNLRGFIASDAFANSQVTLVGLLLLIVFGYVVIAIYLGLAGFALLRGLVLRQQGLSFWTHFRWSWRHIIPIFLLSLYMQIITQAGFVLFVIPGFVAMVYFGYAQYVLVQHDVRGFAALVRSIELVYGRFWGIVGRKLFLVAAVFIVFFIATAVLTLFPLAGLGVLFGLMVFLYVIFCAAIALYESVCRTKPQLTLEAHDRSIVQKWLVAVVLVGLVFGAVSLFNMVQSVDVRRLNPEFEKMIDVISDAKSNGITE